MGHFRWLQEGHPFLYEKNGFAGTTKFSSALAPSIGASVLA